MISGVYIFDCEVLHSDWLFEIYDVDNDSWIEVHNDNDVLKEFMKSKPILCGWNNKHYDNFILKGVLADMPPSDIKLINDMIIKDEISGYDIPFLKDYRIYFDNFDLMDDTQLGTSLKSVEAHIGMDIEESSVSFDIDRPLTEEELEELKFYCRHDVKATYEIYKLRQAYLENKISLGNKVGLHPIKSL